MQKYNPISVGDYITLEQWCNNGINVFKDKHVIWVNLTDDEKTEEKLLEVYPVEYEDFKHQIREWHRDPNQMVIAVQPSFKMCNMTVGDLKPDELNIPEPNKNQVERPPGATEKKNKMVMTPSDEKLVIDLETQTELFDSIKYYKNMVEYMFTKYLCAEHLPTVIEHLKQYYENSDPEIDLELFLNRAFDYDIIKQWFAEGCLTLMIKKILPIIPT